MRRSKRTEEDQSAKKKRTLFTMFTHKIDRFKKMVIVVNERLAKLVVMFRHEG